MTNRNKTLLGILALAVIIGASYIAYGSLSNKYKPNNEIQLNQALESPLEGSAPSLNSGLAESTTPTQNNSLAPENQLPQNKKAAPESASQNTTAPGTTKSPAIKSAPKATPKASTPSVADTRPKAPDFTVQTASGKSVKLSSFFGKPMVVNFWASWCGPCKSEMPHFNKAYTNYKGQVVFMMVDLVDGSRETVSSGSSFVKGQGYSFPVYFDTKQDAANTYRIQSIPTTLFIDQGGHIVKEMRGAMDESTLMQYINAIK